MSDIKRVASTTISPSTNNPTAIGNGGSNMSNVSTGLSSSAIGVGSTSVKKASVLGVSHDTTTNALASSVSDSFTMPAPASGSKSSFSIDSMTSEEKKNSSIKKAFTTIRFNLELFEPNSNTFPEFNFSKLLNLEKKKQKKAKQKNEVNGFSDPFAENDDDVARIAKEMEKKYGTSYTSGRGRNKKDDFCDIGLGYDESDSFIDNTEAYDEIIPEEVETVEGGFYINSGALEFKRLSSYGKTDDIIKMPLKSRKRAFSNSSEGSENSEEDTNKVKKQVIEMGNNAVSVATESLSNDSSTKSEIETLEKRQKNGDPVVQNKETKIKNKEKKYKIFKSDSKENEVTVSELHIDEVIDRDMPTMKTTTVKDMLKAKRDSFLKQQEDETKVKSVVIPNGGAKGVNSNDDADNSSDTSEDDDSSDTDEPHVKRLKNNDDENSEKLRSTDVKLPFDLPEGLLDDLNAIKEAAKSTNRIGKNFHFDDKLTDMFLKIDESCLSLGKPIRNLVFAHLEYQLSLSKYFLLRKAKQLRIKAEKVKTKKAFVKLKKAVFDIMPTIMLNYELNFKQIGELRARMSAEELQKSDHPPKFPKKRFQWNDTIRNLLYDLFQVRWTSFTVLRTRKETFEDFVGNYLKNKVLSIWPSGWMKYEELQKELDKRKNLAKKSKENKKPSVSTNPNNISQPTTSVLGGKVSTNSKQPTEMESNNLNNDLHSKSTLSKSDSLTVFSSRDLVVTIASNRNTEKFNDSTDSSDQKKSSATTSTTVDSGSIAKSESSSQKSQTLMMSTTSLGKLSNSASEPTVPKNQHSSTSSTTVPKCKTATHVINVDNLKNPSEIIDTSNQLIRNKSQSSTLISKDNRSRNNLPVSSSIPTNLDILSAYRRDSSSESDSVEIVGVYPMSPNTNATRRHKYDSSASPCSVRGNSCSRSVTPSIDTIINEQKIKDLSKQSTSAEPVDEKDSDNIDVNQIMNALKGLEKMQNTKFNKMSSPTNNRDNNNHTSLSLSYGKDIKQ